MSALEYFWNRHASRMPNVIVIICGSAASWMMKKIIYNRGGLYGRLSAEIRLQPFSLQEVEKFFLSRNVELTRKQIVEIYMVTGGVPKYLSYVERGRSSLQTIEMICFTPQAGLFHQSSLTRLRHRQNTLRSTTGLLDRGRISQVVKTMDFRANRVNNILMK